jgi:hypothetical protein
VASALGFFCPAWSCHGVDLDRGGGGSVYVSRRGEARGVGGDGSGGGGSGQVWERRCDGNSAGLGVYL